RGAGERNSHWMPSTLARPERALAMSKITNLLVQPSGFEYLLPSSAIYRPRTARARAHKRPKGVSHQLPSFLQQLRQDSSPPLRPLDKRHEPAQLEIGDRLIQTQALLRIISTGRLVTSQEAISQRVEVVQCAKMSQAKEAEMGRKVRHIEQRVVLTELIEIQPGDLIAVDHQMLGREVMVGRARRPPSELHSPLLEAGGQL